MFVRTFVKPGGFRDVFTAPLRVSLCSRRHGRDVCLSRGLPRPAVMPRARGALWHSPAFFRAGGDASHDGFAGANAQFNVLLRVQPCMDFSSDGYFYCHLHRSVHAAQARERQRLNRCSRGSNPAPASSRWHPLSPPSPRARGADGVFALTPH